ncbi:hypothetical protein [Dysgonomonas macrotermitis]|uniref:Uncharacterized protein n=1 Tax=Dysgonomonas macrotermitis TaxID=1346286 RepID=A0A1M5GL66_9BACT|nr:hypothetical protein [Dysgonomonas macrotermitis]SHG04484.1 hypothetical protein SAMN05444362_11453 [Dysgonomonas macrotermitis]
MKTNVITRKQYLNGEATHDEYYSQFVTDATINMLLRFLSKERLTEAYNENPNLYSIKLQVWDDLPLIAYTYKMREAGDWPTPAGKVCILKCAARMIIETKNI